MIFGHENRKRCFCKAPIGDSESGVTLGSLDIYFRTLVLVTKIAGSDFIVYFFPNCYFDNSKVFLSMTLLPPSYNNGDPKKKTRITLYLSDVRDRHQVCLPHRSIVFFFMLTLIAPVFTLI